MFDIDSPPTTGAWSWPTNCQGNRCTYRAEWTLDAATDVVTFTVAAKQEQSRWTGIAFAPTTDMVYFDSLCHVKETSFVCHCFSIRSHSFVARIEVTV